MHRRAFAVADQNIGAGALFEHKGKVLAAHDQRRVIAVARNRPRHVGGKFGLGIVVGHDRIATVVIHICHAAKGGCDSGSNRVDARFGQVAHLGAHGAHGALQVDPLRDHVERLGRGFERGDRHNHLIHRIGVAAGDGLQRQHQLRGHHGGVDGFMRFRGVAALALDINVELVGGGKERPRADRELPCGHAGPVVHAVHFLHAPAFHQAVFAHFAPAAAAFFGGLEDQHDGAVKVPGFGQVLRRTQQHRGVAVVATGVHRAIGLGRIGQPGLFVDRQRIHVGAQADDLARCVRLALDDPDDAGAADAGDDLVAAKGFQLVGHQRAGAVGVEQDLGVFVQVAAPGGDVGVQFCKAVLDGHGLSSFLV